MLNISRQIQAGWDQGNSTALQEAEIVPIGNTANEKRKLQGLTSRNSILKEYENIPLPGFTLLKTERKSWGSLDQTWLVIDPRGFLSRITPNNLEKILHVTGVTEGLIQEKCVWAREDSQTKMVLVPVTSEDYVEAVNNTEMIEGKISVKDINIGDTVLTQAGIVGQYMGTLSLYGPIQATSSTAPYKPQVFLRRQVIKISTGKYFYQADAKILKVTEKAENPMTREDVVELINDEIKTTNTQFSTSQHFSTTGYYSTRGMITYVSTHAVPKLLMSFEEIDRRTAEELFACGHRMWDNGLLLLLDSNGATFLIEHPASSYSSARSVSDIHSFEVSQVISNLSPTETLSPVILQTSNRSFSYGSSPKPKFNPKSLDNFTKYYKIVKNVKTETYL
jgi:hypothetical protein